MQHITNDSYSSWDASYEDMIALCPCDPTASYPTPPGSTDEEFQYQQTSMSSSMGLQGLTQPAPSPMYYEPQAYYPPYPSPEYEKADRQLGAPTVVVAPYPSETQSIDPQINGNEGEGQGEEVMTVSTSFFPGAFSAEADLIVSSMDGVVFYVHSATIAGVSPTAMGTLLQFMVRQATGPVDSGKDSAGGIISLPLAATVVNVMFHAIYETSCAQNLPSIEDVAAAVDALPVLGVVPAHIIRKDTPLYAHLLSQAPLHPIEVYALAAHHDIADLAKQASSYLLMHPLENISDAVAMRIGAKYLRKLMLLHMTRTRAMKDILANPPGYHPSGKRCSFEDQKGVGRVWALGAAHLAWDSRPDLTTSRIQSVFEPLSEGVSCRDCQGNMKKRIREVIVQWASVQTTI